MRCILCSGIEKKIYEKEIVNEKEFRIAKCKKCGFVFTLAQENLPVTKEKKAIKIEKMLKSRQYERELESILVSMRCFCGRESTILDIGCSDGSFLDICRKAGYRSEGIDMDQYSVIKAKIKGHEVIFGNICELEVQRHFANIVVMLHTLEHIKCLRKVLYKIKIALRREGILILEVPNLLHWQMQKKFGISRSLAPERHLYHFTPRTLANLIKKTGYKIARIEPANRYEQKGFLMSVFQFLIIITGRYVYF